MFLDETFVFDKELDLGCRDLTGKFFLILFSANRTFLVG